MKYTKEQRLDIGRQIYDGQLSRYEAAERFGIGDLTARDYMRLYRDANGLPPKRGERALAVSSFKSEPASVEEFKNMTKDEFIMELVKARIAEAWLKRIRGEGRWYSNSVRQQEYQVIMELSGQFPVKLLCEATGILRSSFYSWKKHLSAPSEKTKNLLNCADWYDSSPAARHSSKYSTHSRLSVTPGR